MNRLWMAVLAGALLVASCGKNSRTGAESCVPADTTVLAGIDLEQVRQSPIYSRLPAPAPSGASRMMLAFDGKDLAMIAQGSFPGAPAGWTLVAPNLAVSGTEAAVRASIAQHDHPQRSTPAVLAEAERVTRGKPVWVVARGGAALPLPGNGGNLNPLLVKSEYAYLTIVLSPQADAELVFVGRTGDAAADIEKTLRGLLQLARMGERRQPEARAILDAVKIENRDRDVRAWVRLTPEGLEKLVESLAR